MMRDIYSIVFCAWAVMVLSGCSAPPLEMFSDNPPNHSGPTIKQIIGHVDCELEKAVNEPTTERDHMSDFGRYEYIAQAQLNVDVTDNEGLNPSFSFITPFSPVGLPFGSATTSSTNKTLSIGGQLSATQHRTMIITIQVDLHNLLHTSAEQDQQGCPLVDNAITKAKGQKVDLNHHAIQGDLGLAEAMEDGMDAIYTNGVNAVIVPSNTPTALSPSPTTALTFSSQTDFTVIEGISGGPSWSLVHFKGPSGGGGSSGSGSGSSSSGGGSQGPISVNRTAKDTMLITFVPRCDITRTNAVGTSNTYFDNLAGCASSNPAVALETFPDISKQRDIVRAAQPSPTEVNKYTSDALGALQSATTQAILQTLSINH